MTKETTQKIKGVAICMMILHHVLMPELYLPQSVPNIGHQVAGMGYAFKICVAIFAIITGYGWDKSNKTDQFSYPLKRIVSLLKTYWLQVIIFIPVALIGGYRLTFFNFVQQLLGLRSDVTAFAWYVFFYIMSLLVLWGTKTKNHSDFCLLAQIVLIELFSAALGLYKTGNIWFQALLLWLMYYPCILIGIVCSRYTIFERVGQVKRSGLIYFAFSVLILCVKRVAQHFVGWHLDGIFALGIMCTLVGFFNNAKWNGIGWLCTCLGKHSAEMWFFHGVFFSTYTKWLFQPLITWTKYWPLTFIVCVIVSFASGVVFKCIGDKIQIVQ